MEKRLTFGQFEAAVRRKRMLVLFLALFTLGVPVSAVAQERKAIFIEIDAPGAGTGSFQGTLAYTINPAGAIAGTYSDDSNVYHGFLRAPWGAWGGFTVFDVPGAGTGSFQGTIAYAINPTGAIAGTYDDDSNVRHGFLRSPQRGFTTFDAPGAGTGSFQGTSGFNINSAWAIAGYYLDDGNVFHGFLRFRDGVITTFDVADAGTGSFQGTLTCPFECLNSEGAITGSYSDASGLNHGFVRAPDGVITTFDVAGAGTGSGQGTVASAMNAAGKIVGSYLDSNNAFHGFLRARDGTIITFDVRGAGTGSGQGTLPLAINPAGVIAGNYVDASGVNHGFLRSKCGDITTFDAPGAGTGSGQGTIPFTNNPMDTITGIYIDANNVYHGFLRIP
jgi:hypothetical protein